jgi:Na+/proline symporter
MNEKNEKKTMRRAGWMAAVAALVLAVVFAISGAPRVDARVPEISKASASTSSVSVQPGEAHADSDTCDLQLD